MSYLWWVVAQLTFRGAEFAVLNAQYAPFMDLANLLIFLPIASQPHQLVCKILEQSLKTIKPCQKLQRIYFLQNGN